VGNGVLINELHHGGCPADGHVPDEAGGRALLDGIVFPGRDATSEPLGLGGTGG